MASTFKTLLNNDVVSTRTMLHEAIPLTGTIVSGTYSDNNIKNFAHGMFQSVYDYPYLSSSANHIFDITVGFSSTTSLSASSPTSADNPQQAKKINIYNQMAQVLVGYDVTGNVRQFDQDGDLSGGTKLKHCVFINFARLLNKDEIKKQSFSLTMLTGGASTAPDENCLVQDVGALNAYKVNSPAGEYGLLYSGSADGTGPAPAAGTTPAGLVFYQAGVCVLTASLFAGATNFDPRYDVYNRSISEAITGSLISASCDAFRNRFVNVSFNNTTELNSTIYFCRANNNEFNYSANPTYLTASKLRVKNNTNDTPVSYITTVGLYSADNELLATAKLSEPLKKTPDDEFTLRVRLDY
tara:strand:- start:217 stop:1281 length:1065 start_codon:yes stop_codon:yes gene_type:complete